MNITVTQEDIDDGRPGNAFLCPVALATKRDSGMDASVSSHDLCLYRNDGPTLWRALLPAEAATFIDGFDASRAGMPFSFEAHFMDLR